MACLGKSHKAKGITGESGGSTCYNQTIPSMFLRNPIGKTVFYRALYNKTFL